MKKKFNIMLCTLIGVLSACNEYDFDQEQYRNEVGLLSNSSLIYDCLLYTSDAADEL